MKTIKTVADIDPTVFTYADSASFTSHRRGSKKFTEIVDRIYKANPVCVCHEGGTAAVDDIRSVLHEALAQRVADTHEPVCSVSLSNGVPVMLDYIYYYRGETYSLVLTTWPR